MVNKIFTKFWLWSGIFCGKLRINRKNELFPLISKIQNVIFHFYVYALTKFVHSSKLEKKNDFSNCSIWVSIWFQIDEKGNFEVQLKKILKKKKFSTRSSWVGVAGCRTASLALCWVTDCGWLLSWNTGSLLWSRCCVDTAWELYSNFWTFGSSNFWQETFYLIFDSFGRGRFQFYNYVQARHEIGMFLL